MIAAADVLGHQLAAFHALNARHARLVGIAVGVSAIAHVLYLLLGPGPEPRPYQLRVPPPPLQVYVFSTASQAVPPPPPEIVRHELPQNEAAPPALPALPAEVEIEVDDDADPDATTPRTRYILPAFLVPTSAALGRTPFQAFTSDPKPIHKVMPRYPELARMAHAEGQVEVQVDIDERGRVVQAVVVRSNTVRALDAAALDAARRWLFQPALQRDMPVPARYVIRFTFNIGGS